MKSLIASTLLALTLIAGVAGTANAAHFDAGSFFQQLNNEAP